jgi:zinc protease
MTIISATAIATATAALAAERPAGNETNGPAISHYTLKNGLEIVVIPDHRTPVVTHMIWYRVGSADEDAGRSGLAHFLEHLMFKGTAKNPKGRFSETLAILGGQENAFTSQDYTAYFQRVSKEHLSSVMEFEADRMTGLVLNDDNVLPERDVVLEERRSRTDSDPGAQLAEAAQAALFVNHPYGKPIIGWEHEIRALNREQALEFYKRFYAPNNAILVVAGDVTGDGVKALAEKHYGGIARRDDIRPRVRPAEPEPRAHRRVSLADPRVQQPSFSRTYTAPSYRNGKPGETEAIDVLSHILGSGSNSRLHRKLVMEKGVAVSAGSYFSGTAYDLARFGVYASPKPGTSLEELEAAVDAVIADIAANGVLENELARAKTKIIADFVYAQDSQATLARMYGAALTVGIPLDDIKTWPDRLRAVKADDVRNAARTWLDTRRAVTSYLTRPPAAATEKRT